MGLNDFILTCEKDNKKLREDVNYYKNMASRLKKKNQELKKHLDDANEKILLLQASEPMLNYKKALEETQQKEFIKYLEDEIKELQKTKETELDYDILRDVIPELLVFKDVLQKYKKITGDDK